MNTYEALLVAAKNGNLDQIKNLITNNKYTLSTIINVLHTSITNNHFEIVKYFVENGIELTQDDLLSSLRNYNFEISEYIIRELSPMEINRVFRNVVLHRYQDFDTLDFLIRHGADVKTFNNIALIESANLGHENVVKYLMKFYTQGELQTLNIPLVNKIQQGAVRKITDIVLPWLYNPNRKSRDRHNNNLLKNTYENIKTIYNQNGYGHKHKLINKLCKKCNVNYKQDNRHKYRGLSRYFKKLSLK